MSEDDKLDTALNLVSVGSNGKGSGGRTLDANGLSGWTKEALAANPPYKRFFRSTITRALVQTLHPPIFGHSDELAAEQDGCSEVWMSCSRAATLTAMVVVLGVRGICVSYSATVTNVEKMAERGLSQAFGAHHDRCDGCTPMFRSSNAAGTGSPANRSHHGVVDETDLKIRASGYCIGRWTARGSDGGFPLSARRDVGAAKGVFPQGHQGSGSSSATITLDGYECRTAPCER